MNGFTRVPITSTDVLSFAPFDWRTEEQLTLEVANKADHERAQPQEDVSRSED